VIFSVRIILFVNANEKYTHSYLSCKPNRECLFSAFAGRNGNNGDIYGSKTIFCLRNRELRLKEQV
ncbi:hypothetical protein, partial [uncultured Escherichia sp.]